MSEITPDELNWIKTEAGRIGDTAVRRWKQLPNQAGRNPHRSCGDCSLCCTVMEVVDTGINKPAYEPCAHLACGRCGIYEQRPQSCRAYACFWALGLLPEEWAPSKVGFFIDVSESELNDQTSVPVLTLREAWTGAFAEHQSEALCALAVLMRIAVGLGLPCKPTSWKDGVRGGPGKYFFPGGPGELKQLAARAAIAKRVLENRGATPPDPETEGCRETGT